ncbi:MAG: hypothetical protein EBV20_13055, partial [Betaproteobacteria bacterium]|nr:hypothetical protein [Betaproteobacteria bacterium]
MLFQTSLRQELARSFGATLPYRVASNGEVSLGGDINLMRISLGKPQGSGMSLSLGTSSTLSFSVPGTSNPNQTVSSAWQEVPGVSNLEASLTLRSGTTNTFDLLVRQKSGINATDADFVNALRSLQLSTLNLQEVVRQDVTLSVDISSNNGSTWVGANSTQLGSQVFHFSGPAPSAQWARFGKSEVYIGLEIGTDAGGIQNLASRGDTNQGTPSTSLFTVTVNGARAQVLEVTVDHGLRLALDRELNVTDIVNVSYSSPALEQRLNVLQDRQGNDIASFSLQAQSDVLSQTGIVGSIGFPGGWDTRPDFERQLYDKVFGPGGSDLSFRISQVNPTTHEYAITGVGTFVPNSALDPALVPGYSTSMYTRERLEIVGGNAPTNWVSGQTITVQELLM